MPAEAFIDSTLSFPPPGRLQRCSAACEDQVRDAQQRAGGGKPDAKQQAALQKQ